MHMILNPFVFNLISFRSSKVPGHTGQPDVIKSDLADLRDIVIFDENNQPRSNSPCSLAGNGYCNQLCFSFPVSQNGYDYECACATGVLKGKACSTSDTYIVYSTRSEIRSEAIPYNDSYSDSAAPFNPIVNMTNVVGVDFDYEDNKLFFTQIRPQPLIGWMDARKPSINYTTILSDSQRRMNPEGIAFDWVHKRIYWTDSRNNSIYSMKTDGSQIIDMVRVERPRAIALAPCKGYMFFTDWGRFGESGKIYRATMAGTYKVAIIERNLTQPSGLTIDYEDEMLYFTDAVRETIERCDFNGTRRRLLVSATIYPFAVTIDGDFLYWTDLQLRGLFRAEKHTGRNIQIIAMCSYCFQVGKLSCIKSLMIIPQKFCL